MHPAPLKSFNPIMHLSRRKVASVEEEVSEVHGEISIHRQK
jgi:hypothetical protein